MMALLGCCMLFAAWYFSESAKRVSEWAQLNCLSLNTKKEFNILNISNIQVNSIGDKVPFVDVITSLGVKLDSTLSWRPQVLQVTKNVNRVLYFLRTIRP